MRPCSTRPAFTAWWRNGKIVKRSSRSQKKTLIFVDKKREGNEATNRMVCCNQQALMYEMWTRQQAGEKARTMHGKAILGRPRYGKNNGQGEFLIWCRKRSGYARQSMGPKLMNFCKPEQVGTKEYGKMLKRIQILEDGRILAREARNWMIEGQKRRITEKVYRRLWHEFEMRGFMAQKGVWESRKRENVARQRCIAKGRRRHCQRVLQGHA